MTGKLQIRWKAGTFREEQHPREDTGKFSDKPGGGGGKNGNTQDATDTGDSEDDVPERAIADISPESQTKLDKIGLTQRNLEELSGVGVVEDEIQGYGKPRKRIRVEGDVETGMNVTIKTSVGFGASAYDMERTFVYEPGGYPSTIINEHFYLDSSLTGEGIGTKAFSRQVDEASKAGFKKIVTLAGKTEDPEEQIPMNGYYTWPRLGYDGSVPASVSRSAPRSTQDAYINRGGKGDYLVSDFMKSREGREFWRDNGIQMEMTFDLTEGSLSRRVLDEYARAKGIKKEWRWLNN